MYFFKYYLLYGNINTNIYLRWKFNVYGILVFVLHLKHKINFVKNSHFRITRRFLKLFNL